MGCIDRQFGKGGRAQPNGCIPSHKSRRPLSRQQKFRKGGQTLRSCHRSRTEFVWCACAEGHACYRAKRRFQRTGKRVALITPGSEPEGPAKVGRGKGVMPPRKFT